MKPVYLLDTNIISNIDQRRSSQTRLRQRILSEDPRNLFISAITVEEVMQGSLAQIQQNRYKPKVTALYQELLDLLRLLCQFQTLPYTNEAERIFQSLPPSAKRVSTADRRIAAIAHTTGMTIITANISDFEKIGIAPIQDWTQ